MPALAESGWCICKRKPESARLFAHHHDACNTSTVWDVWKSRENELAGCGKVEQFMLLKIS
jgi:hypothetical protein